MPSKDDLLIEEEFAQKRMSAATFTRLVGYLRPYKRAFALNLLFTLLATLSQLLGPKFIQIGIDRYLTGFASAQVATQGILVVSAIYLGNLLLGWFLSVVQVKTAIAIGQGAIEDIRLAVFEHIQKLSLNYFDKTHQGRIISRADNDIEALDRIMTWGANQLLASVLTLLGVLTLMLQYDWRLCLAVSAVIPPLVVATRLFHKRGMPAYRKVREQGSRITGAMAENITGVRVAQAFAREEENLARFQQIQGVYFDRFLVVARIFHTYMPFVGLVSGLGTAIVLGYGGSLVMQREITVGELAAFILYLGMFFGPIQTMGDLYNTVLSTAASAERIFQLLDTEPQILAGGARPYHF
jgi:ABC-type multidrug transport system fused ATPase/permease subunit